MRDTIFILLIYACSLVFSGCAMSDFTSYRERSKEKKVREKEMDRVMDMHNAMKEAVENNK